MIDTGAVERAGAPRAGEVAGEHDRVEQRIGGAPFLRVLVFAGGFASIGVELTASRLLAPFFGNSTFIWASLIGLTLAFLSLGYFLGGKLADRRPEPDVLYAVAAVAAVAIGTIPFVARPLLTGSLEAFRELDAGAFYGSLAGTLLLLAPPVTLLGFISPFAIRLQLSDVASAGKTAGSLYALSTIGSIAGSFIPVLVLIPLIGTSATFVALSLALLVPAMAGLVAMRARPLALAAGLAALAVPALAAAAPAGVRPPDRGILLHEQESAYNYIQVVDQDGRHSLILNEGHAVHSVYDPDELLTGGPWDYFMIAPMMVEEPQAASVATMPGPHDALLIGLAGGTVARQLTAAYGPIPITGVEIDPAIDQVAREYFALGDLDNVTSVVADGRYALRTSDTAFDLIGVDAYRQPYIPFQLTSREFFQDVSAHLRPGGVAVVNAGRTQTDFRLVEALASTMRDVFPYVVAIDVDRYTNTILIGSQTLLSADALIANVERLPDASPVHEVAGWSLTSGNIRAIDPGGLVFTDDRAPVELVIDQMIFDAAREIGG
jgi:spermidine synthase